jgi:type IV pilus assembly protein PilM
MPASAKRLGHNPVVGIEFGHDQIRAVEVRHDSGGYTVTAAGVMAIPPGSMDPGSSTPPDLVGQRVKSLLKKIGSTSRYGVFGVPSSGVFTRLLDVPQLSDEELGPVVAGEVAHYQMVRPGGGAFDFIKLEGNPNSPEAQVSVMAADDPILWSLDSIGKASGIAIAAKEPAQYAAIRASVPAAGPAEPTLFVSVEDFASEIAIIDGKKLRLYRRIDVGGHNLLANIRGRDQAAGEDYVPAAFSQENAPVDEVLSARLATEIRRSLDYFRRTNPDIDVNTCVVHVMDRRLEGLAPFLGGSLGLTSSLASPIVTPGQAASLEFKMPYPMEFMGALGLAMGELGHLESTMPRFNLLPAEPVRARSMVSTAPYVISAFVTAAVAAIAGFMWFNTSAQANTIQERNVELQQEGQKLLAQLEPLKARRDQEVKILADLTKQGVPFPWVMDEISRSLDPSASITEVTFEGGRIRMIGEAKTEAAMISTLDQMRINGNFSSAFIDNFDNKDGRGFRFNLSSAYALPEPEINLDEPVSEPGAMPPSPAPGVVPSGTGGDQ